MTVLEFGLECTVSGVGQPFRGTLGEALIEAMQFVRNSHFRTGVWFGGRKVAECSGSCCEWLDEKILDSDTIPCEQYWEALSLVRRKQIDNATLAGEVCSRPGCGRRTAEALCRKCRTEMFSE